ncbi:uncharacterized protein c1orf31 [Lynx pardinus]|uniref:Cytochrome c oxidase assembly factor 6 homolog n=4 Tax=Felinae TaxID=338152 RepID=A0A485NJ73_LYNPA|nr:uncharacterized protein c1orf31 [Lynx pardinus]
MKKEEGQHLGEQICSSQEERDQGLAQRSPGNSRGSLQQHSSQGRLSPVCVPASSLMSHVVSTDSWSPLGMAAPSMKERQACWGARDEYWKCLDENTEDASRCKKLRSSFESSCPQQWIKYFDKRRDYLKFKEKFEAGQFQPSKPTVKS